MTVLERLALSASVIALTAGAATVSQAQTNTAPAGNTAAGELEQVVVTARRRLESLQDVPIAVTALGGEALQQKGITNAIELARQVPNVTIGGGSTNPQLMTFGIRGIRQKEPHIFFDQSVVLVFAEAVMPHPYGFGEMLYDLESVEILKGPQGTLFGRNSPAGAVIFRPNEASVAQGFHGSVAASLGDYDRRKFNMMVNVPLGEKAAFRLAAEHFEREGYITNLLNGDKWNGVNNDSFRASLTLEPSSNFRNVTIVDWLDESASPSAVITVQFHPKGSGALVGGPANANRLVAEQQARGPWDFVTFANTGRLPHDTLNAANCRPGSTRPHQLKCSPEFDEAWWLKTWGAINRTELDLGWATVKNVLGYRYAERDTSYQSSWNVTFADGTGGPGNHSITGSPNGMDTWTEELQLSGLALGERLDWVTGAFYMFDGAQERNYSFQGIGLGFPTSQNYADSSLHTTSWGLYGQGTYAVTDRFDLTAGVRYSDDRKRVRQTNINIDAATGARTCALFDANNVRLPATSEGCVLLADESWSAMTWNFSANYELRPDTMGYATVSRGYRSGSFFPRAIRPSLFAYDPEYVTNYELGLKSEWTLGTRPIRTNLAVYRADQSDMQVQVQDVTTVPLSGFINNAGKSRYWGGEFEFLYRPTTSLTLQGYASYTDFKYVEYTSAGVDLSWQKPPQPISHWNLGATADYYIPLNGDSGVNLRADISWTSDIVTENTIDPNAKADWDGPAYTILNLRAEWRNAFGAPVTLAGWVTNVTNEWYMMGGTCLSGTCTLVPSPPRMFGMDLKYEFGG